VSLIADIFEKIIVPATTINSIPEYAQDKSLEPICANLLCEVDEETSKNIDAIMGNVIVIMGGGKITRILKRNKKSINIISGEIEVIKTPIYRTLAYNFLEINSRQKVVIMVLHINTIKDLSERLSEYGVVVFQGSMSKKERTIAVDKFQEYNSNYRVFIGSIRAGSESIDLHDTSENGQFPRLILIPPCYFVKAVVQSTRRVFRDGLTSRPEIKIVYTTYQGKSLEKRYYDSVETKSKTISACQGAGQKAHDKQSLLPCDYPNVSVSLCSISD